MFALLIYGFLIKSKCMSISKGDFPNNEKWTDGNIITGSFDYPN